VRLHSYADLWGKVIVAHIATWLTPSCLRPLEVANLRPRP